MMADDLSADGMRLNHGVAAEWRTHALQVVADLLRVERIVADAARELLESFDEAERCLAGSNHGRPVTASAGGMPAPLARAVAALQFEDMVTQLLRSARTRLEVATLSIGSANSAETGASSAGPLPAVAQDSVACGTVEFF